MENKQNIELKTHNFNFNIWHIFRTVYRSLLAGNLAAYSVTLLGLVLLRLLAAIVNSTDFFPNSFDFYILDPDQIEMSRRGRIGFMLSCVSFIGLYDLICLMLPIFNDQQEQLVIKHIVADYKESKRNEYNKSKTLKPSKSVRLKSYKNFNRLKYVEDIADKFKYPLISPNFLMKLKKRSLMLFNVVIVFVFLFSIITNDKDSINILNLLIYQIGEYIMILLVLKFIIKEALYLCPIIFAFELIQYLAINTLNAQSYGYFALYRLFINFFCRTMLEPLMWKFSIKAHKIKLESDSKTDNKTKVEKFLSRFKLDILYDKIPFFHFASINYEIKNEIPREYVLLSYLIIISKASMRLISCFTIFIIYFFPYKYLEFDLRTKYLIMINQLIYFFIHLVVDLVIIWILDHIYGFEILDYIHYLSARYYKRKTEWLLDSVNHDQSIQIQYRSLDFFCFSPQFYYLIVLTGLCLFLCSWGVYIMCSNYYNFLSDASSIFFIIILLLCYKVFRYFMVILKQLFNIWKKPRWKLQNTFKTNINFESYIHNHIDPYREEFIIDEFIKNKKDVIIEKLPNVFNREDFFYRDGYLIDLYNSISNSIKNDQINKIKYEIIEKNKFVPIQLDSDRFNEVTAKFEKEKIVKLMTLLYYWHSLSKETLYFKRAVSSFKREYRKLYCENCRVEDDLRVVEIHSIYDLIKQYRVYLGGMTCSIFEWENFYRKKQKFLTLCKNCKKVRKIKQFKHNNKKKFIKNNNKFLFEIQDQEIFKQIAREDVKSTTYKFIYLWLLLAKSSLLHLNKKKLKVVGLKEIRKIIDTTL